MIYIPCNHDTVKNRDDDLQVLSKNSERGLSSYEEYLDINDYNLSINSSIDSLNNITKFEYDSSLRNENMIYDLQNISRNSINDQ